MQMHRPIMAERWRDSACVFVWTKRYWLFYRDVFCILFWQPQTHTISQKKTV